MAVTKKFDGRPVPVQLTAEWRDRIKAVSDHPTINDSMASVIRDCVALALPGFELELGIRELDDLTETELDDLGLNRVPERKAEKEDRAAGSFGYVPPAE